VLKIYKYQIDKQTIIGFLLVCFMKGGEKGGGEVLVSISLIAITLLASALSWQPIILNHSRGWGRKPIGSPADSRVAEMSRDNWPAIMGRYQQLRKEINYGITKHSFIIDHTILGK
jgi:hypothetical protein